MQPQHHGLLALGNAFGSLQPDVNSRVDALGERQGNLLEAAEFCGNCRRTINESDGMYLVSTDASEGPCGYNPGRILQTAEASR